jgi:hypothetical protein
MTYTYHGHKADEIPRNQWHTALRRVRDGRTMFKLALQAEGERVHEDLTLKGIPHVVAWDGYDRVWQIWIATRMSRGE